MKFRDKYLKTQVILIISTIMGCFFFILGYLVLNELPGAISDNFTSVNQGKSMIFPDLPIIKLFTFRIIGTKPVTFTVGHLVDIVTILVIIMGSETIIFHVWKLVFHWESYRAPETVNLYVFNSSDPELVEKIESISCFLYEDQYQTQSIEAIFKILKKHGREQAIDEWNMVENTKRHVISVSTDPPTRSHQITSTSHCKTAPSRIKMFCFNKHHDNRVLTSFDIKNVLDSSFETSSINKFTNTTFTLEKFNEIINYSRG
ncbi:MAG: hypothetical protein ACFFCS_05650 [Candidatus Hodarchaeota archaeon]